MFEEIKKKLSFNEPCRDAWIKERAASIEKGAKVLDVGAGSCPYRELFDHCEYQSHDFTQLTADQLRDPEGYGRIDFVSDICEIPVPDESFDVAICTEVLEHVPHPILAVKEIGRLVKPGGELIMTAPLGSGLHQEPYHFYGGYTPHWYMRFLGEAGFKDIEIQPNRGFFSHLGQECMRFAFWLAPWKARANLKWLPLWIVGLPFCFGVALLGRRLDRLDSHKGFTIGYHVTAVKSSGEGPSEDG